MLPLTLSALTAVSAMGRGLSQMLVALESRQSGLRACDFEDVEIETWIGRVAGVEAVRLPLGLERFDCRNNRLAQMALETDGFAAAVRDAARRRLPERIAVVLGTSTSGILTSEHAYRRRDPASGELLSNFDYEHTHDMFSLARFVRAALGLRGPASVISTACSSAAKTFGEAAELISSGVCDAAVVGGADSLCGMTLYGFAALDLLAKGPCRPFATERDGISIGEAAALVLLERPDAPGPPGRVSLLGFGASADAHHMTSPHPEGLGAVLAMREALASAGLTASDIDYVNFHGTGTRANDLVEDQAVFQVVGRGPACSSTKGWSGHTLGTSGALEAVIGALCLEHGLVPGCLNVTELDPGFRCDIAAENRARRPLRRVLSNSFGFGGSNCSLILGVAA
jgi:3-oxoacyl-[acyl-carrier-protein] synthase-1